MPPASACRRCAAKGGTGKTLLSLSPCFTGRGGSIRGRCRQWIDLYPLTRIASAIRPLPASGARLKDEQLARIHRNHPPAVFEPIDARQRQRVDHKTQRASLARDRARWRARRGWCRNARLGSPRPPAAAPSLRSRARSDRRNFRRRAAGCWRPISRIRDRLHRVRVRVRCDAVRSRRQNPVRGRRPVRLHRDPASRPSLACGAPGCTPPMRLPAVLP